MLVETPRRHVTRTRALHMVRARARARALHPAPGLVLDGVHEALVVGRAQHVARGVVAPLDLAQGDGHRKDLRLGEHRALAERLLPLFVVHVAVRVRLDLRRARVERVRVLGE